MSLSPSTALVHSCTPTAKRDESTRGAGYNATRPRPSDIGHGAVQRPRGEQYTTQSRNAGNNSQECQDVPQTQTADHVNAHKPQRQHARTSPSSATISSKAFKSSVAATNKRSSYYVGYLETVKSFSSTNPRGESMSPQKKASTPPFMSDNNIRRASPQAC